jgi:eukaryotic-like serine/threonine-protein kinase
MLHTCPPDEELLPLVTGETLDDSLRSHLDSCSACRHRYESFRSDLAALKAAMPTGFSEETLEPVKERIATIGKYLVCGRIDGGGQADVYRALHPTLDTEVAIKLGRKAMGRLSEHRPLLVAEGKMLAKLDHPNLARVFDLDFHEDRPFLAMEYIRGANLRAYAEQGAMPPRKAAVIVAKVARAVAAVHRQGIVHMDIKPQNILIDEKDQPRLIDFGLARVRHAWDDDGQGFGGTPAYMAPEQARGDAAQVGPRTDVFALGGVLYYLLAGQPPFRGSGVADTLELAGKGEFDRKPLDSPNVPKTLKAVILKAMALNPQERYHSAEELAQTLERYAHAPTRRKHLAMMGGGALALAGVFAAGWFATRPKAVPAVVPPVAYLPLEIQVSRKGEPVEFAKALPLKAETDRVQLVGRAPKDQHVAILFINARGKIKRLPAAPAPGENYTKYVFPGDGQVVEFDPDGPGTEFVLIVGAATEKELDGIEDLVASSLGVMPVLPPKTVVEVNKDEAKAATVPFGKAERDPVAELEARLEFLRRRLDEKKMLTVRGIAYKR